MNNSQAENREAEELAQKHIDHLRASQKKFELKDIDQGDQGGNQKWYKGGKPENDPEVEAAATKIQAGFKGMKARKEVKDKFQSKNTDVVSEASTNEIVVEGSPEPLNDNKDAFQIHT